MAALSEANVQPAQVAFAVLGETHFWRDVTPVALDGLGAMEKAYPAHKDVFGALREIDTLLAGEDQKERNLFHKGIYSALAEDPQASYSALARGIRSYTEGALTDVKALGVLSNYKSRGRNAESFMARLGHEIATTPMENLSERLDALNDLLHAEYEGGPSQRLALATLTASEVFDDSILEGRDVARRGLELGAEFATQNQDRVARVAMEESLKLASLDFEDRGLSVTVPRTLLSTFAESEKFGPADLARAGYELWDSLGENDQHLFLPALVEAIGSVAQAAGDREIFPPRLQGLTVENAPEVLEELADFQGEPYWGSVDPAGDVDVGFGENEVVIGDVPLPRE